MADFNTQTPEQIEIDLLGYGYTLLESTAEIVPTIMWFRDSFDTILKLDVGLASSKAIVYLSGEDDCWKEQEIILAESVVTDLNSLDILLVPEYSKVDSLIFCEKRLTSLDDVEVLSNSATTYYQSTKYTDLESTEYFVSELPSPYRTRDTNWVSITFDGLNWVLTYNPSEIVDDTHKITNAYGDFLIVK